MLKRLFTILLCGLLFETMLAADTWALAPPLLTRQEMHVKNAVDRLGTGADSLVAVRLQDKSVMSGRLSEIGPHCFQVVDPQTGITSTVRFVDVNRLVGTNLVSGDTVQYGTGIRAKLAKVAKVIVPGRQPTSNGFATTTILIIGIVIGVLVAIVVAKSV